PDDSRCRQLRGNGGHVQFVSWHTLAQPAIETKQATGRPMIADLDTGRSVTIIMEPDDVEGTAVQDPQDAGAVLHPNRAHADVVEDVAIDRTARRNVVAGRP